MIVLKTTKKTLTAGEIRETTAKALATRDLAGKKVLAVVPDQTRSCPLPALFRVLHEQVMSLKAKQFDVLIALGTHPPMTEEQIDALLCLTPEERKTTYGKVRIFNHLWKDPATLKQIGTITEDEVAKVTGGLLRESVPVTVNKLLFDYDHILIVSPVFPHEVAGFSGGHKYFFPGCAAHEIIDFTHWLGAVCTNPVIIGNRETPVRKVIEHAAGMIKVPRTCIAFVVGHGPSGDCPTDKALGSAPGIIDRELCKAPLTGIFAGDVYEAWTAAADFSAKHHILWVDKPFKKVLSCAPKMYDDIWTAGKCMYKLESALADGAELIIYAPHVTEVSYTHGKVLDRIGYHCRDYFLKQMDKFAGVPRGVMAHSTHVKGIGTFINDVEKPRCNVILATGIPEERCKRINLGYLDPKSIKMDEWTGREKEGIVVIPRAGEHLYRLKDGSIPRIPGDPGTLPLRGREG